MRLLFCILLVINFAGTCFAYELKGSVRLSANGQSLRAEEALSSVVYFRPKKPVAFLPADRPAVMTTLRKQFLPRILPITRGSSVRFPNRDPILHNAYSTSANNIFDAGLYSQGEGVTHTFKHTGLVRVYCNVHHAMFGFILVLDTPYFTRPNRHGEFVFTNLPAGEGDLVVFHERAAPWRLIIDPSQRDTVTAQLVLDRRKVPAHHNKFGKPYSRGKNAEY